MWFRKEQSTSQLEKLECEIVWRAQIHGAQKHGLLTENEQTGEWMRSTRKVLALNSTVEGALITQECNYLL